MELWMGPTILEDNLELCPKGIKRLSALWFSYTNTGFIPQNDNKEKHSYKNIHSLALCGGKKIGKRGYTLQLGNGWINCGNCWWWNIIVLKGIVNWQNSMWTGITSRNWCRVKGEEPGEHCIQSLINCGTIKCNGLLC